MSQLNFSMSAPRPNLRRRAYNPRGKVRPRPIVPLWLTIVSIGGVMAVVFAVVWYV